MAYAVIEPEGMFGGDRMAMLSDTARLMWPWFWCAHNTVGRTELNYRTYCDTVFRQFKKKPAEQQFWDWVSEYHECYLMFVYQSGEKVWGQWDVLETVLPRHKKKADQKTPAAIAGEFLAWRSQYAELKNKSIAGKCRVLSLRRNFGTDLENRAKVPLVVDVDVDKTSLSAEADGGRAALELPAPEERTPPLTEDDLVLITAQRICARHPAKRKCGPAEASKRLKAIIAKSAKSERAELLGKIDRNHESWCESEQWTKAHGEYAKGLANWLAPTEGRFNEQPPARASPEPQRKLNLYKAPTLEETDEQPTN